MKNKGFTLIELLAVIVILALILIIAVPNITKQIKKAKVESFKATAQMILKQIDYDMISGLGLNGGIECRAADLIYAQKKEACRKHYGLSKDYSVALVLSEDETEVTINLYAHAERKFGGIFTGNEQLIDIDGVIQMVEGGDIIIIRYSLE